MNRSQGLFYVNSFVTLLAGNMFNYGMIILTRSVTASDALTGTAFLGVFGPTLLFGFYAGVLLDRMPRKLVLHTAQGVMFLNMLVFAFLLLYGFSEAQHAWLFISSSTVHGVALAFIVPSRFALIGNLFKPEQTGRATILLNILLLTAFGGAPFLTGLVRQSASFPIVFGVITLLFLFGYLALIPVKVQRAFPERSVGALHELRVGLSFILEKKIVLELLLATFFGLFIVGPIQVLLPEFARSVLLLGEAERGAFMGCLGVGLLIGGVLARTLDASGHRGWIILMGILATGGTIGTLSYLSDASGAALMMGLAGVAGGALSTLIPAAIQMETPDHIRGRVMSIYSMLFQATPAISGFSMGLFSQSQGLIPAIFFSGLVTIGAAVFCMVALRQLRTYGRVPLADSI